MKKGGDLHLVQYTAPEKRVKSVTDLIIFRMVDGKLVPDDQHCTNDISLFKCCPIHLQPGEKAMIMDMQLLYSSSDFDVSVQLEVENMFSIDNKHKEMEHFEQVVQDEDLHPDFTGNAIINIPSCHCNGILPHDSRTIYRPLYHDKQKGKWNIPQYAGTEDFILHAKSTHIMIDETSGCYERSDPENQYVAFMYNDPFIVFLLEHHKHFSEERSDDIKMLPTPSKQGSGGDHVYLVRRPFMERVQRFFKNAVYPLFHYTTNPFLTFGWKVGPKSSQTRSISPVIAILVQLDYMVISPGIPKFEAHGLKIKL